MVKNILVSALGAQPDIIEETVGYINFKEIDFYEKLVSFQSIQTSREEADFSSFPIDELWLVATDREGKKGSFRDIKSTFEDFKQIEESCSKYVKRIRLFVLQGVNDITNDDEAFQYRDLAYKVIAYARQQCDGGRLYLSLACGRKTMSADFQEAAYCFGCDALIHVLGDRKEEAFPLNLGAIKKNEVLKVKDLYFDEGVVVKCTPDTDFLTDIQNQKRNAQHFYTTYYLDEKETRSNFYILYTLPPSKIKELKTDSLGIDPSKQKEELEYLQRLPKSDLHCHLGGVLTAEEMIEVAKCYLPLIEKEKKQNLLYSKWDCKYDKKLPIKDWYKALENHLGVHKGLIASRFILEYEDNPRALEQIIFGNYIQESDYKSIGINAYESLGDLQGSALLCNETAIRKTVQILLSKCKKENIAYLEIRCSPINYQTSILSPNQVLQAIFEELEREPEVETSVIMIASRHGGDDKILQSIELTKQLKDDALFKKYFRGFDLAGDESAKSPKEVREQFLEIMKDCYNITIHAGETAPAENIWEAVYHLTAERIGHGLKLIEKEDLMVKFLERGIGIEMCPSSNYQIVGYRDNYFSGTQNMPDYPLKKYLDCELKVSVNTDNPGISLTTPTQELHRAARLTRGGLSKWDLLQLTCNGFRTAFYPYEQKKQLIRRVEEKISELIKQDLL